MKLFKSKLSSGFDSNSFIYCSSCQNSFVTFSSPFLMFNFSEVKSVILLEVLLSNLFV